MPGRLRVGRDPSRSSRSTPDTSYHSPCRPTVTRPCPAPLTHTTKTATRIRLPRTTGLPLPSTAPPTILAGPISSPTRLRIPIGTPPPRPYTIRIPPPPWSPTTPSAPPLAEPTTCRTSRPRTLDTTRPRVKAPAP
ncbi:hypothetical protein NUW54_g10391 [Trametes sanguinea]|uniref:Uncharacterized protein n=1 Tax=Trametes sanguinea TaxID=158606 RepID=A0ACC1P2G9_9APHY|nr:hypothetical protein NUW54_g10391 [Trametes sanguinea]